MFFPFAQMVAYARVNGERRDDVGDFAASMVKDSHWPLFCDDRERLRAYIESQGAGKPAARLFLLRRRRRRIGGPDFSGGVSRMGR